MSKCWKGLEEVNIRGFFQSISILETSRAPKNGYSHAYWHQIPIQLEYAENRIHFLTKYRLKKDMQQFFERLLLWVFVIFEGFDKKTMKIVNFQLLITYFVRSFFFEFQWPKHLKNNQNATWFLLREVLWFWSFQIRYILKNNHNERKCEHSNTPLICR